MISVEVTVLGTFGEVHWLEPERKTLLAVSWSYVRQLTLPREARAERPEVVQSGSKRFG